MNPLFQHLVSLESELHHNGILCTPERLQTLLHPKFHEVGQSGNPYSRDTVIRYLTSCTEALPVRASDHTLQALGTQQMLLTYLSALTLSPDETAYTWRASVWVQTDGNWQLLYHQGTPASAESVAALRAQGKL